MRAPSVLFALAILLAGCHRPSNDRMSREPPQGEMTLRVLNRNRLDVTVYVVHEGFRDRVGVATASMTSCFTVLLRVLGAGRDYHLLGDPIGSRGTITTETLHAQDGDSVTWDLEDSFARSTVSVGAVSAPCRGGSGVPGTVGPAI